MRTEPSVTPVFHNEHDSIRFIVRLSFVSDDHQNGYQHEFTSHAETKEAAIVQAIQAHLDERYPLKGISVYQCIYTA